MRSWLSLEDWIQFQQSENYKESILKRRKTFKGIEVGIIAIHPPIGGSILSADFYYESTL